MKELIVGNNYSCLDIYGMVSQDMKYIGQGRKYTSYNGAKYYKDYNNYYVFEKLEDANENSYKYALAEPTYSNLNWTGDFKVIRYGNDLSHIFVDFTQVYFSTRGEHCIEVDEFPQKYERKLANSGVRGSLLEK